MAQTLTTGVPYYDQAVAARQEKAAWKLAALIQPPILFLCLCGVLYFASRQQIYPYVAFIRPGESLTLIGVIPQTFNMTTHSVVTREMIGNWLYNSHQLTADEPAYDELYTQAEAFQSQKFTTTQRPFKYAQKERRSQGKTVTIDNVTIQPLAGSSFQTWELDWRETTVSIQGYEVPEESGTWHATVRVIQGKPVPISMSGMHLNPFRLFIDEFSPQQRTKGY